jgi:threonine dehydratase
MNKTRIFSGHEMVRQADARIRPYVRETGVEPAFELETGEGRVWLKLENQQVTGSFKVRGALNRMQTLTDQERTNGVITASAGNHGLGVAYSADRFNVPATIFVPKTVDSARKKALERYPVELRLVGDDYGQTEEYALGVAEKTGRLFVSPYNDADVIAGQGTIGIELLKQIPDLDAVFVAVGGGGLISGIGAYIKGVKPEVEVVAVSPSHSPAMFDVLSGTPEEFTAILDTLADSTAGPVEKGSMTIDLCRAVIDHWILVEEDEIVAAMKYLFMEHRLVVEGSGALVVAGYMKEQDVFKDKNCALVVCGGNIDAERFCDVVLTRR